MYGIRYLEIFDTFSWCLTGPAGESSDGPLSLPQRLPGDPPLLSAFINQLLETRTNSTLGGLGTWAGWQFCGVHSAAEEGTGKEKKKGNANVRICYFWRSWCGGVGSLFSFFFKMGCVLVSVRAKNGQQKWRYCREAGVELDPSWLGKGN